MQVDILTLFPEMFAGPFGSSIVKRAVEKGLVTFRFHNIRDWSMDNYKSVDDRPYGGGPGMILRVDIVDRAIQKITEDMDVKKSRKVILLDATGSQFNQKKAEVLAKVDNLVLICGHYEGVDHRIHEHVADEVLSVGPYVLSGGEIPAMVIADTIVRLIPGSLGNSESLTEESNGLIDTEYPQYTRPDSYRGWKVPEVLLSGNHKQIKAWRGKRF